MGIFDFFGKKKKEEQQIAEILKLMAQHQVESRKDGVETDDIPKGYGPFGLSKTNPIPTNSVSGSDDYLSRLRTKDGHPVESSRLGSTSAPDVTSGMIDIYAISRQGVNLGTVFLCPYHKKISTKAPEGFVLV